ncbi:thiomuracin/GE37468 family thiazolyl RiPP peptide [Saccharothrix sp. NRRL B-16348]|uniref:thiomuracin/GE37468 family thiazolyl RiPP peptide n=1 Tax=Saccharothrix sp. NRRL B-16348 TaxID=1415542 RepID=UPI000AA5EE62|nr:thiomuracin/GE37468 family thiazolyl RiPP peptide [Saccharothrix sp. NRRL B-16348]
MSVSKPVLNLDDLLVETIGVVPAPGPEELTQGHGVTELGASCDCGGECDCDCDCTGSCEAIA